MKLKIIITLLIYLSAMPFKAFADEFRDLYCSIMKPDTTRAGEISNYMMLNSLVPELVENQELSQQLVDKYMSTHSDLLLEAFVDIFRKYFTLDEMKSLRNVIEAETADYRLQDIQREAFEAINQNVIMAYVGNVLKEYNESKNLRVTSISELPKDYYDRYIKMIETKQGKNYKESINFSALFKMSLLDIEDEKERELRVETLNRHIQDDYFRYAANRVYEAGVTMDDLEYVENHFLNNPLLSKQLEATLEMTHINMGDYISKRIDTYTEYLSSEGYAISPITLNAISDYLKTIYCTIQK